MTCPPDALVHLDQISKVFLTEELETRALSQIQLTIHDGEFVAIVGPSGCGKSTLLSVLGLLESPSSGTYCLAGRSVAALPSAELARTRAERLGFIFQAFNLIGDLRVAENVGLPLEYRQMDRTERQARVHRALDQVGMIHRAGHYPSQLSGGQQQRVAIARAIAGDPSILLADEPTGNLDSRSGDAIMELFAELHQRGRTICMVTHDMGYASRADRIIHLLDGEITQDTNARGAATGV